MIIKLTFPIQTKGGPGSGHHGHSGRPGQVGGSVSGSGVVDKQIKPKVDDVVTHNGKDYRFSLNDGSFRLYDIYNHNEMVVSGYVAYRDDSDVVALEDINAWTRMEGLGRFVLKLLLKYYKAVRSSSYGHTSDAAARMWEKLGADYVTNSDEYGNSFFVIDNR